MKTLIGKTLTPALAFTIISAVLLAAFPPAFAQTTYNFIKIADSGGPEGITRNTFQLPSINNSGTVLFTARTETFAGNAIFLGSGGPLAPVEGSNSLVISDYSLANNDQVFYRGVVSFSGSDVPGLRVYDRISNTKRTIALSGYNFSNLVGRGDINASGNVVFRAIPLTGSGFLFKPDGPFNEANPFLTAYQTVTALNSSESPSINAGGIVAFGARLDNGTFSVLTANGGTLTTIASTGELTNPVINNNGRVAFKGTVSGVPGIYLWDGTSLQLIQSGLVETSHNLVSLNDNDEIAYLVSSGTTLSLYVGTQAGQTKVLETGTTIVVDGAPREVVAVEIGPKALNNSGQIACLVIYQDADLTLRYAIYRADLIPNEAPVLGHIGDKSIRAGSLLTFPAVATDPGDTLTFSLDAGAPAGASIDPSTGLFSWTPTNKQGPMGKQDSVIYPVTVRVTDSGSPALSDFELITITVTKKGGKP